MKNLNRVLLALGGVAILAAGAPAYAATTASSDVTANVVLPVAISNTAALGFGQFAGGAAVGTVEITPAGARNVTGDAVKAGGTVTAAAFNVTGTGTLAYTVSIPISTTITNGTPAMDMTVDTFKTNLAGGLGVGALTAGAQTVNFGATLHVLANQAAGAYTGTYDVSVAYN